MQIQAMILKLLISLIMGMFDSGTNSPTEFSTLKRMDVSTRHWNARADFSKTARSLLPYQIIRYTITLITSISILKASIPIMHFLIRKIYLFLNNNNNFMPENDFL